jgi:hypothetical protein
VTPVSGDYDSDEDGSYDTEPSSSLFDLNATPQPQKEARIGDNYQAEISPLQPLRNVLNIGDRRMGCCVWKHDMVSNAQFNDILEEYAEDHGFKSVKENEKVYTPKAKVPKKRPRSPDTSVYDSSSGSDDEEDSIARSEPEVDMADIDNSGVDDMIKIVDVEEPESREGSDVEFQPRKRRHKHRRVKSTAADRVDDNNPPQGLSVSASADVEKEKEAKEEEEEALVRTGILVEDIEDFVRQKRKQAISNVVDAEALMHLLHQHGYNLRECQKWIEMQGEAEVLRPHRLEECWTDAERRIFFRARKAFGTNLPRIISAIPLKTRSEIVDYYYRSHKIQPTVSGAADEAQTVESMKTDNGSEVNGANDGPTERHEAPVPVEVPEKTEERAFTDASGTQDEQDESESVVRRYSFRRHTRSQTDATQLTVNTFPLHIRWGEYEGMGPFRPSFPQVPWDFSDRLAHPHDSAQVTELELAYDDASATALTEGVAEGAGEVEVDGKSGSEAVVEGPESSEDAPSVPISAPFLVRVPVWDVDNFSDTEPPKQEPI